MDTDKLNHFMTNNPAGYAGFRAIKVADKGNEKTAAEVEEVPFIFSILFLLLIFAYTTWKRANYIVASVFDTVGSRDSTNQSHIFIMTSSSKYRSYGFEQVGKKLIEQDKDVMFVCSPDATDQMAEWRAEGFRTESFNELLRFVSISTLLVHIVRSLFELYKLKAIVPEDEYSSSTTYTFNSIVLEHIKYLSLNGLTDSDPVIHSYSLMPYQVLSTIPERRYVYQHGVQLKGDEKVWLASRFFPANILIWGETWLGNFEDFLHPDSTIQIVGSPWHDYLAESRKAERDTKEWDVVLIGGSQATTRSARKAEMYENLVENLVNICETNGWKLAFKLHPVENRSWYDERGWGDHVTEFDGINDALKNTEIAVTHFSSAFVESIMLGTPIILDEAWSEGMSKIRPISGASFIQTEELEETMNELLHSEHTAEDIADETRLVDLGRSTERILEEVTSGH